MLLLRPLTHWKDSTAPKYNLQMYLQVICQYRPAKTCENGTLPFGADAKSNYMLSNAYSKHISRLHHELG